MIAEDLDGEESCFLHPGHHKHIALVKASKPHAMKVRCQCFPQWPDARHIHVVRLPLRQGSDRAVDDLWRS
jgi:hypothetical protein